MEDGNTSLSSSGVNAKTVYEKELDYKSTKAYTQYLGYDGKYFLDYVRKNTETWICTD